MRMRSFLLVIIAFYLFYAGLCTEGLAQDAVAANEEEWSFIPEGARPSYMGIHGGTMPVSLLVSGDGTSLLSFVGRTGDDFMEALRKAHIRLPSLGNSTKAATAGQSRSPALFAGNATASLPVFSISDTLQGRLDAVMHLMPFGLSRDPLPIEGTISKPENFPHARTLRPFRIPDYFKPRTR